VILVHFAYYGFFASTVIRQKCHCAVFVRIACTHYSVYVRWCERCSNAVQWLQLDSSSLEHYYTTMRGYRQLCHLTKLTHVDAIAGMLLGALPVSALDNRQGWKTVIHNGGK